MSNTQQKAGETPKEALTQEKVEKILKDQKKPPMLQVRSTPPIKLKDKAGRGGVQFTFRKDFGFVPESIVIQKVAGRNNTIVVSAIIPQEILDMEIKKKDDKSTGKESKTVDQGSSKVDKGSGN